MDIINAFTYTFKRKNWYYNLLLGAIIAFPLCISEYLFNLAEKHPFDLPYFLLAVVYGASSIIVGVFLNGYLCANAHYRLKKNDAEPITWTNLDIILLSGLKTLLANIIYKIPLIIILFFGLTATLTSMLDVTNNNPSATYNNTLSIISAIAYIIEIFIIPSFIIDLKLDSLFNFKRMGSLIKNNPSGFLVLLIVSLAVTGIYTFLKQILSISPEIWIIIDSILTFYIITIRSDLFTQFVNDNN